ncbi:WD40/YVTN/BNR-like repeat-containing protein [Actinopolymorpha pittospori]|uniref:Photosystem II stability/assembly factor-like uncharacterized protein n=1 Tax=Actinopolymorpha pittospori TaxID=648752 RepID=A0A927R9T4_9ACTN|nr:hypothetical protein [Actinopolymorpha pittospori]MBE1608207.1 photosystem II stability/assembly factor-like uncharacterized protein [Actinopolymorpha pittospori]
MAVLAGSLVIAGSNAPAAQARLAVPQEGPPARAVAALAKSAAPLQAPDPNVTVDPALFEDLSYRDIGPSRGGRVTAVEGIPSQPSTFYMGATGGGVWKTTDFGQTWNNISDGFFDNGSIGAIRVAPSDPDIIYVGTGSSGLRSNVIIGNGVYKSTDAGKTWTHVGLEGVGQIGRMAVDPKDPNTVYVGAIGDPFGSGPERGVYKTTDGGRTWKKVLYISPEIGVYGLVLAPGNPNVVYASAWRAQRKPWTIISGTTVKDGAGIYKSTDGGKSWKHLSKGLPDGLVGKIDLSVSAADPERVYALLEAPEPKEGLYRSDDSGESWTFVSGDDRLMERPFYYTNMEVDPTNADVVYVLDEGFFKSTDGGKTWQTRPTPHGDNHDLWISPDNPQIMIESNDGGANVTLNGGQTWSTQLNQPTAELYQVDLNDRFPYSACAGQQDASTICVPNLPPGTHATAGPTAWWQSISGCETGPAVPKPGDADIIYGNCKGEFSVYNLRTGQEKNTGVGNYYMYGHAPKDLPYRFQRTSPIEVSSHDPKVVYYGSQYVHRTTDEGEHWQRISPDLTARPPGTQGISGEPITRDVTGEEFYSTLYAIEESPLAKGLIWVGSNDGPFHVTRNDGKKWTDVTPDSLPPGGRVQNIEPSPHDPGTAYYAVYRYLLDDFRPYIYKTEDYGRSWTLLTDGKNGIPANAPTHVIREDPEREGLLYAGTDLGMYVSFDDGAHWQPFQQNLPRTPVTDIKVHDGDLVLSTMGRGFWVLDDLTPLRQLTAKVEQAKQYLFAPDDAYRMRYSTSGGMYPPAGALIDYYLAKEPAGEVKLEIRTKDGRLVRAFSSEPAGDNPPLERAGTPVIPKGPGMHRVQWDLAHHGPWDANVNNRGEDGPLAVPGTYEVRLTVGKWSQTRTLKVVEDPRVTAEGVKQADLNEQLGLSKKIVDTLSQARRTAARIETAQQNLADETGPEADKARQQLAELEATIVTDPNEPSYPQPMLIDQIDYLYGMTTHADQKLGRDAFTRYGQVHDQLNDAVKKLDNILHTCGTLCS